MVLKTDWAPGDAGLAGAINDIGGVLNPVNERTRIAHRDITGILGPAWSAAGGHLRLIATGQTLYVSINLTAAIDDSSAVSHDLTTAHPVFGGAFPNIPLAGMLTVRNARNGWVFITSGNIPRIRLDSAGISVGDVVRGHFVFTRRSPIDFDALPGEVAT